MKRGNYPVLSMSEFGRQTILSGDLDPVYPMAYHGIETDGMKWRFCLAHWCSDHCGVSAYIAESSSTFWERFRAYTLNETESPIGGRWPRGTGRRHWRGANGRKGFEHLYLHYAPQYLGVYDFSDAMLNDLWEHAEHDHPEPIEYKLAAKYIESLVGFGPWAAFKVADMMEQILEVPIDFDSTSAFFFDKPRAGANLYFERELRAAMGLEKANLTEAGIVSIVSGQLLNQFKDLYSPNGRRRINLQEVETLCCKYHKHVNGRYPLYHDLADIRGELTPWMSVSPLAKQLLNHIPVLP